MSRHRLRWRGGRGQSLVEFSLVIPIFLVLLIAVFDLGRGVFAYNTLTNAAREGARMAIVNQDTATIIADAKRATAIVELNNPSVQIGFYVMADDGSPDLSNDCSPVAVGCLAVVSFEADYRPITPVISNIVFGSGVKFTAMSVLSVEYQCPNSKFTANQCPNH
jgi:Flp pilus assembly protein TadG